MIKNNKHGVFKIVLVENTRKYFYNDDEKGSQVALLESLIST